MLVCFEGAQRLDQVEDMIDSLFDLEAEAETPRSGASLPASPTLPPTGKPLLPAAAAMRKPEEPRPAPSRSAAPALAVLAAGPSIPSPSAPGGGAAAAEEAAALAAFDDLLADASPEAVPPPSSTAKVATRMPATAGDEDDESAAMEDLPDMKKLTVVRRKTKRTRAAAQSLFVIDNTAGEEEV